MRIEAATAPTERRRWLITGQVQGVGFRPFVFRAARRLALQGFVQNGREGVVIEAQGQQPCLDQFEAELRDHHPALARIRTMASQLLSPLDTEKSFRIIASAASDSRRMAEVTADTAVCNACVEEILSQTDRRAGYALTNCTNCGPRYSIIRKVPYDRNNTTMAGFEMCPTCRAEYLDPEDRRFHAQPIACPNCGPQVSLVDPQGEIIAGEPIFVAREMLLRGEIVAIKGLGGFHLAVRADDERAVSRLRRLKKRDHKPFAVMAGSIEIARELAELGESAVSLMQSPACPIVLARRRDNAAIASAVAPGSHRLGLMLPYTPIHHLLLRGLPPLVMTSGNLSDEPLAIDNHDAQQRLGPMCDALLLHDRPIQRGVDDSVVIDTGSADTFFVRRARGYVPSSIPLPTGWASQGICVGGELKNTVAVVRDQAAILSQHLGDLSHPAAYEAFGKAIDDLQSLFDVAPDWIAHDLHPSYVSTMHARKLAARMGVPAIAIQHHHAHAASLLAEHGLSERILAVVCDGTGYGLDGTIWGGELLAADLNRFERLAHLRPMRLAGGDAAARETARCALSLLHDAFGSGFESLPIVHELLPDRLRRQTLCRMIRDNIACVPSSGTGRVFDGVAAILGLCARNHYEAQAGLLLESAAQRCTDRPGSYVPLFDISGGELQQIDLSPLIRELVLQHSRGTPVEELSCLLHEQVARAWVAAVGRASERLGLRTVGVTGGVFCNAILTLRLTELLEARNLRVLRHRLVPPNDGGLALGQAAIAATRFTNAHAKGGSPCA